MKGLKVIRVFRDDYQVLVSGIGEVIVIGGATQIGLLWYLNVVVIRLNA